MTTYTRAQLEQGDGLGRDRWTYVYWVSKGQYVTTPVGAEPPTLKSLFVAGGSVCGTTGTVTLCWWLDLGKSMA